MDSNAPAPAAAPVRADNVSAGAGSISSSDLDTLDSGTGETSHQPPPETVRFVACGEPFDIPWSLLSGHWTCTGLFNAASFALRNKQFDPNDKYDPRVVLVKLSCDIRSFRAIASYVKNHVPIIPPDPVDRQLLAVDAGFYGVTGLVEALIANRPPAKKTAISHALVAEVTALAGDEADSTGEAAKEKALDSNEVAIGDGYVAPSPAAVEMLTLVSGEDAPVTAGTKKPWAFWAKNGGADGKPAEDLDEADRKVRALEYEARLRFAKDEDATALMKTWTIDDPFIRYAHSLDEGDYRPLAPAAMPNYQFLAYPGLGYPLQEATPMVDTLSEFEDNFNALTLGVLRGAIKGLPFVVAGGIVLAALHKWPREAIPEKTRNAYLATLSKRARRPPIERVFVAEFMTKGVIYEPRFGRRRWRMRNRNDSDDEANLAAQVALLRERLGEDQMPTLDAATLDTLGLIARANGVKWDEKGKLRPSSYKFRPPIPDEEDEVEEEGDGLEDFDDDAPHASTAAPHSSMADNDGARPDNVATAPMTADSTGADADVAAGAAVDTDANDDNSNADDDGGGGEDVDGADLDDGGDSDENGSDDDEDESKLTAEQRAEKKNREMIEKQRERVLKSFRCTDVDLFLITRSADEAITSIFTLYKRILRMIPRGSEVGILRTAHSISFILPAPYRTIQVVTRLYHSVEQVLLGFDVDCCSFAYTGKKIVTIPRAVRSVCTRTNIVDPSRQSTTYEHRLMKYAKRNFRIAIPGADVTPHILAVTHAVDESQNSRRYLSLSGLRLLLGMLYAVSEKDRDLARMLSVRISDYGVSSLKGTRALVRRASRYSRTLGFVYVIDDSDRSDTPGNADNPANKLHMVLLGNKSRITWRGDEFVVASTLPQTVCFQKSAPHAQDRVDNLFTGSFHATTDDWYGSN